MFGYLEKEFYMNKDDKVKALDAAIAKIEKDHGKGSIMKLGDSASSMNVETTPTGSLSLDVALGQGGIPKGRVVEIYGPESSGKTTVALHMIAEVQKQGVGKATLPPKPPGEGAPLPHLLLAAPGLLGLGQHSSHLCPRLHTAVFPLCVSPHSRKPVSYTRHSH